MTELIRLAGARGEVRTQVVFVHGLSGHHRRTWLAGERDECWPSWLSDDLPGVVVWSVGYDASLSRWNGYATHLADRGPSVLYRLIAEPELRSGEIVLIGHSLGGLVIKQALRTASEIAPDQGRADEFVARVKKVAFLATPHAGSGHANLAALLRFVVRPSAATASLVRNDPNLRNLNVWYRDWSRRERIQNLVLMESRADGWLGLLGHVVKPDSADPGLLSRPILLDATHTSICKPANRSSEAYIYLKDFIGSTSDAPGSIQRLREQLGEDIGRAGDRAATIISNQLSQTVTAALSVQVGGSHVPSDELIRQKLSHLQRARFVSEFPVADTAARLAKAVLDGDLGGGSQEIRGLALAWCARLQCDNISASSDLVLIAASLTDDPSVRIAESFILAAEGRVGDALAKLRALDSPASRSAALMIVRKHQGDESAYSWMNEAGVDQDAFDSEGRLASLLMLLQTEKWEEALNLAKAISEPDFAATPALLHVVAVSYLAQAVPEQLRHMPFRGVPFDAKRFPLRLGEPSLTSMRTAKALFTRFAAAAEGLGCDEAQSTSDEYALWLELRDPATTANGLAALKNRMRSTQHSLHLVYLAVAFGIKLDHEIVDREIRRQEALAGRATPGTASARLAIAFSQPSIGDAAKYIEEYRKSLTSHFGEQLIDTIQADLFTQEGAADHDQDGHIRLPAELAQLARAARIGPLIAKYEGSHQLVDLIDLVQALKADRDGRLAEYAERLVEETQGIPEAELLAHAYFEAGRNGDVIGLAERYPHFLPASDRLLEVLAWALYLNGRLRESAEVLERLKSRRDHANDRALGTNLAISSGSWGALLPVVEREWQLRDMRSAHELMTAASLGVATKSPRTSDLIRAGVAKAPDDASILFTAYMLATRMGGESSAEVAGWLHRAAEASGSEGPVQRMHLKDLVDSAPLWRQAQSDVLASYERGEIPIFLAAQGLKRSLIELFLAQALLNQTQTDLRHTAVIPAFSGAMPREGVTYGRVVIDATALLTLGMLGLLDKVHSLVDVLVLPHATMAWLFEEKQKVEFHQPSRIADAKVIQALLSTGAMKEFRASTVPDPELVSEVGEDLAAMLSDAANASDEVRIVVKGSPVYRVASLMEEEVDLSEFRSVLRGCLSVVSKLSSSGQLTSAELQHAKAYLGSQETPWPDEGDVPDGAVLLLDDVSLSYLKHLNLLEKIRDAGLAISISPESVRDINDLIQYEQQLISVANVIEYIRSYVEDGIKNGAIEVGPALSSTGTVDSVLGKHPIVESVRLAGLVDVVVSDDRFVNQNTHIEGPDGQSTVVSSLDILSALRTRSLISDGDWREHLTRIRRSKYVCVPFFAEELGHYVSAAGVVQGRLTESAELRAIRENLLRLRMGNMLRSEADMPWLIATVQAAIQEIRAQWVGIGDTEVTVARSNWLFSLCDIREWSHRFPEHAVDALFTRIYPGLLMFLATTPADLSQERAKQYAIWADEAVFSRLKEQSPDLFDFIIERARDLAVRAAQLTWELDHGRD